MHTTIWKKEYLMEQLNGNSAHLPSGACANNNVKQKDIYKDTPVRYLGFTNELGTAVKDVCGKSTGFVRHIPSLSYVPAVGYIACDVFDKYKKGEDGTGRKPSVKIGARELITQTLTSVLAPTGVILATQNLTKKAAGKFMPKMPKNIIDAFTKNNNKLAKISMVAISIAVLCAATKPIDKLAEKVVDKIINPLFGIKHKEQTVINVLDNAYQNKSVEIENALLDETELQEVVEALDTFDTVEELSEIEDFECEV